MGLCRGHSWLHLPTFTAEYDDADWTARYALALMPTVANGIDLSMGPASRACGENYELIGTTGRSTSLAPARTEKGRKGAGCGCSDFRTTPIWAATAYRTTSRIATKTTPVITAHPLQTTVKYGIGLNFEQELTQDVRVFLAALGGTMTTNESYAYTEVAQTSETGRRHGRQSLEARAGQSLGSLAFSNVIKRDHQRYLALGRVGFLLGDGALSYARERHPGDVLHGA